MSRVFPLNFPFPTAFYLVAYIVSLIVHVVFMNYVLAGTTYLLLSGLRRRPSTAADSVASVLRDWLPFATSAAITAGVAPLLFLQILYKKNFYTANLLLFHRWMAIVPVLIIGFYLLYLLKTPRLGRSSRSVQTLVAFGAFSALAFTAWSWTENHLLSAEPAVWPSQYESGALLFCDPQLIPRLATWLAGAFPTMCVLVGWQIYFKQRHLGSSTKDARHLAGLAVPTVLLSSAVGTAYALSVGRGACQEVWAGSTRLYLPLGVAGIVVQLLAWSGQRSRSRLDSTLSPAWLGLASVGLGMTLLGATVVREGLRLTRIDITRLFPSHSEALGVGGLGVFATCLVLNFALIAYCIWLSIAPDKKNGFGTRHTGSPP